MFLKPEDIGTVLILAAGDIAYAGLKDEYKLAVAFFAKLRDGLKLLFPNSAHQAIFLPGNHDCNFSHEDQARKKVIEEPDMDSLADGSIIDVATSVQNEFFEFCKVFSGSKIAPKGIERLYSEHGLTVGEKTVTVRALNSAWLSKLHESRCLMLPVPFLAKKFVTDRVPDVVITALHHPYNWFEPRNANALRKLLDETSDIIVTGHEHDPNAYAKTGAAGEQNDYVEGGVLQESGDNESSSFNTIVIDLDASEQQLRHFIWSDAQYETVNDVVTRDFVRNKNRLKNEFILLDEFETVLDDSEAVCSHPHKDRVGLSDVFLYPDFAELDEKRSRSSNSVVYGKHLITHVLKKQNVLITGGDKAGKTAISRTLFGDLRRNGKIPLFLSGRGVKVGTTRGIEKSLDEAFGQQYCAQLRTRYWQLTRESRAVVLDDFHRLPAAKEVRDRLVTELKLRFEVVVLVGGSELRYQELVGHEKETTQLWEFNHLEVMAFGHRLRSDFIKKWYRIGRVGQSDDSEMAERAVAIEKTISNILGHDILPPYPVYLLLLLQQLESANKLDVTAASYGRLYGAVLTAYLAKSGVSSDLETKINYLTEFAQRMYSARVDHMSEDEAEVWHDEYCRRHLDRLSYPGFKEELISSHVLIVRSGHVSFRYKAGFYYFVACYLADRMTEEAIKDEVRRLCSHLHRESAANIVLFLCHLSKDPVILEEVLATAGRLFAENGETDIIKDAAFASTMSANSGTPVLELADPEQNRIRSLDELDASSRPLDRDEESYTYRAERADLEELELDIPSQNINTAIKTIQIAGQILRNLSGRMEAEHKVKLTDACYAMSLRMMKWIYSGFEENEVELINAAKVSICERNKNLDPVNAHIYANCLMFGLLKLATLGLIKQVSNSVGLEKLSPVFKVVLDNNPSVARRLIDLSIRLDHFGTIPVDDTLKLEKDVRQSPMVTSVLRQLVFNRFYYFTAPTDIKQRLCAKLGIELVPALLNRDVKRNI